MAVARSGRTRRGRRLIAGLVAVVVGAVGGSVVVLVVFGGSQPAAAAEVALQPVGDFGPDPFARIVDITEVAEFPSTIKAVTTSVDETTGTRIAEGTTPELYGGLPTELVCDIEALESGLDDPARGSAWAGVLGIRSSAIADSLDEWTPALLTADTWITSHSYSGRRAVPHQTVLQRGTAVLIDAQGVPRVTCASGSPLLPPSLGGEFAVTKPDSGAWQGYRPGAVTSVEPGETVEEFVVVDLENGRTYTQPVGGSIKAKNLTLAPDGLGVVSFGDSEQQVVDTLEELLGDSDREVSKSYGGACRTTTFWWGAEDVDGDSLVVEFDDVTGEFLRYLHTNSGPDPTPRYGVETPEGLAAGAPLDEVSRLYPGAVRRTTSVGKTRFLTDDGYVFSAALDPGDSDPYIETIEAGSVPCEAVPG